MHRAGQKIEENSVKKVLEAAGLKPEEARIKALVAALEGVDIAKAIEKAAAAPALAPAPVPAPAEKKPEVKKEEEEKKLEEATAAGLGALFG